MKNYSFIIILLLLVQSCTKEVITKKEFIPATAPSALYGTWKRINNNPADLNSFYFIISSNDNIIYTLSEDKYGYRTIYSYASNANNKQLNIGGGLYNYTIINDTLKLKSQPNEIFNCVKVSNPNFTPNNWVKKAVILKSINMPNNTDAYKSIGINGDNLYFGNTTYGNKVYKFNTLTQQYIDSIIIGINGVSNFYKNGTLFYGFEDNARLAKTTELQFATAAFLSLNQLSNIQSMSYNGTSNTFYAFNNNNYELYAGSEGGNFNLLTDFRANNYPNSVVYYGNDEFLAIYSGSLCKIKISPTFKITESYQLNNYSIYSVSTNGTDVWAKVYNSISDNYEFLKLNIN